MIQRLTLSNLNLVSGSTSLALFPWPNLLSQDSFTNGLGGFAFLDCVHGHFFSFLSSLPWRWWWWMLWWHLCTGLWDSWPGLFCSLQTTSACSQTSSSNRGEYNAPEVLKGLSLYKSSSMVAEVRWLVELWTALPNDPESQEVLSLPPSRREGKWRWRELGVEPCCTPSFLWLWMWWWWCWQITDEEPADDEKFEGWRCWFEDAQVRVEAEPEALQVLMTPLALVLPDCFKGGPVKDHGASRNSGRMETSALLMDRISKYLWKRERRVGVNLDQCSGTTGVRLDCHLAKLVN